MIDLLSTPHPDNLAWKLIENLLPTQMMNVFTAGLQVFFPTLAFFGSLFVAYHVIVGIVASAYSGKVLGEKYHQIWAPLRVILGFGMLIGVPMTGLSGVHYLERLIYQMGVNSADAVAVTAVEYVVKDGHSLMPVSTGGRQLAWNIVTSEVCTAVHRAAVQHLDVFTGEVSSATFPQPSGVEVMGPPVKSWLPWKEDEEPKIEKYTWDWGLPCGTLSFTVPTGEDFGTFAADRRTAMKELVQMIRDLRIGDPIAEYVKTGPAEKYDETNPFPPEDVKFLLEAWPQFRGLISRVNGLGDSFDKAIASLAAQTSSLENVAAREKLVEGVRVHGYLIIGSYYRTLSHISSKSSSYAAERATFVEPSKDSWGGYKDQVGTAMAIVRAINRAETNRLLVNGNDLRNVGEDTSTLADLTNAVSTPIMEYMTGYDGWRPDPIGDLINLGARLLGGGQAAYLTGLAATGAASLTSALSQSPQKILEYLMVAGWPLIGFAIISGALLSYVLPMIPYIFMVFATGALAMEVIAFAIAGLLWAFIHIRMDGQDLVDQAQAIGYKAAFSLFLRQPITVLGFLGASVISTALINIFLMTWNATFTGSQGNGSIGGIGVFVNFAMMIFIQWHIYLRIYALILELPTRVAAIFGASIPGWHDDAHGTAVVAGTAAMISTNGRPSMPAGKGQKTPPPEENNGGKGGNGNGASALSEAAQRVADKH